MKKSLKCSKNTKNYKHTKNHNHITYPQIECRQALCQFWAIFVPLTHFWPKKSKFLKNEKKKKTTTRDIIILHTLRCLINMGVRDFS